jgi:hypothetical protein
MEKHLSFQNLNDACRALLMSTVGVLNGSGLRYFIAGGWVPILLEPNHPTLTHPGTRDVDVLMVDELSAVQAAAHALLADHFRPSAKHEFQLLRDAEVGTREFVFNVDLMHPYEAGQTPEMFSDIFDLGVDDAYDPTGSRHAKSIAFRSAEIVYKEHLFTLVSVAGTDLDDRQCQHEIPILTAPAFLLSKCESASIPKRTRDAFDIHYILSGVDGAKHAFELRSLAERFSQVDQQVDVLRNFLRTEPDRFNHNVSQHAGRWMGTAAEDSLAAITSL